MNRKEYQPPSAKWHKLKTVKIMVGSGSARNMSLKKTNPTEWAAKASGDFEFDDNE